MSDVPESPRSHAVGVAMRTVAAVGGGYALASLSSTALALTLPMAKRDAVQLGVMIGFLLFAAAAVWAFSVRSAFRAWAGILLAILPCAAMLLLRQG